MPLNNSVIALLFDRWVHRVMPGLVEALIVTIHVDFPRIAPGDKNEVSRCQGEANWPPEGSDQQSIVVC